MLRYLDAHRLDHTPEHYAFAHLVLFGHDRAFKASVQSITEGGVRISPEQVRQLAPQTPGTGQAIRHLVPELDGLALRVLDIASDAASASGELHRDLVTAVAVMVGPEPTDVRPIINAMIDRTARAEVKLAEATRQAQRLRDDLNALDNDTLQDRLTGLLDRVAMERRLATAAAGPTGYLIAIIDVDGLRAINDEYGHAVGDRVLKAVAETLSSCCSPHPIARWQGGRFIILFEGVSASDVFQMVDNARQALAKRRMKLRENDKPLGMISFSAGIVSSRSRETAVLLDAAARLVRETKERGRNTVTMEKVAVGL